MMKLLYIILFTFSINAAFADAQLNNAIEKFEDGLQIAYRDLEASQHDDAKKLKAGLDKLKTLVDQAKPPTDATTGWIRLAVAVKTFKVLYGLIVIHKNFYRHAVLKAEKYEMLIENRSEKIKASNNQVALKLLENSIKVRESVKKNFNSYRIKISLHNIALGMQFLNKAYALAQNNTRPDIQLTKSLNSFKGSMEQKREDVFKSDNKTVIKLFEKVEELVQNAEEALSEGKTSNAKANLGGADKLLRRVDALISTDQGTVKGVTRQLNRLDSLEEKASTLINRDKKGGPMRKLFANAIRLKEEARNDIKIKRYKQATVKINQSKKLFLKVIALSSNMGNDDKLKERVESKIQYTENLFEKHGKKSRNNKVIAKLIKKAKDAFQKKRYEMALSHLKTAQSLLKR